MLHKLTDNLILFAGCVLAIFSLNLPIESVALYSLVYLFVGILGLYMEHPLYHYTVLVLCILIGLFFSPVFLCSVFIIYNLFDKTKLKIFVPCTLVLIIITISILNKDAISILFLLMLSILLSYRSSEIITTKKQILVLRDDTTELNNSLVKKNKDLMEKQDYEIHVATLSERNRIAREIHDNVGHMLSRSILQIGALMAINKDDTTKEMLVSIKETLDLAMNNIRESVHDLHDESIDLRQALNDATSGLDGIKVNIDYDAGKTVPRNVKYAFINIVKEAVSNTVKHSNADKIDIIVREHPSLYQLQICDNGTKEMNKSSDGIGIENMRNRVESLNGTFTITNENGFKIFISIPR